VTIAPFGLDRVAADALPAGEVEAFLAVAHAGANDMAHHIGFPSAGRAGAVAAEEFQREVSLDPVVPRNGKFGSNFLDGGRLEDRSHAVDLVM